MISRAIVTGGAGFIGSHVVDSLVADGAAVTVMDDLSSGLAERVAPEATLEQISITDADAVAAIVDSVEPEAIFTSPPRRASWSPPTTPRLTAWSTCRAP